MQGTTTITPTTIPQSIQPGTYITGKITVEGSTSLLPQNIKKGVTIFGVAGTCTEAEREYVPIINQSKMIPKLITNFRGCVIDFTSVTNAGAGYYDAMNICNSIDGLQCPFAPQDIESGIII
jgi:hypothetical protein